MKNPFKRFASAVEGATADLTAMRGHIAALKFEVAAVRNAPLPRDEAVANVDRSLDQLASRTVFDPMQFASPLHTAADPELERAMLVHFLRPAARANMIAALDLELEKRPPGLPKEGRAEKVAELEAQLLAAERAEEEFVEQAREAGLKVARRADADPRAVLGVEP
jgi:hypothetical protein